MLRRLRVIAACFAGLGAGCVSARPEITPDQRSMMESREIDGGREDVLRAAAAVMLDEGFVYTLSDHEAGLLGGVRLIAPQYGDYYARQGGLQSGECYSERATVWVRGAAPGRCEMRVQFRACGSVITDEKRVSEIWTKVQRRMLAYLPPRTGSGEGGRP